MYGTQLMKLTVCLAVLNCMQNIGENDLLYNKIKIKIDWHILSVIFRYYWNFQVDITQMHSDVFKKCRMKLQCVKHYKLCRLCWYCSIFYLIKCISETFPNIFVPLQGGVYLFRLIDNYAVSGLVLLAMVFLETLAIGWVYGKMCRNITQKDNYCYKSHLKLARSEYYLRLEKKST